MSLVRKLCALRKYLTGKRNQGIKIPPSTKVLNCIDLNSFVDMGIDRIYKIYI